MIYEDAMYSLLKQIFRTGIKTETRLINSTVRLQVSSDLQKTLVKHFGRALAIRHVDAGSCNGCELEIQATNNPYYNLEGLGIHFVASPKHADLLLVTGPVSKHMEIALKRTYDAMPEPKWVIALGDCGCTGGIFGETYATSGKVSNIIPVDLTIPGCPPTPMQILQGISAVILKSFS
jgi:Ni,Fe-hydrogenase III small subunit